MGWDRIEYDKHSNCACGKGQVIKRCWQENDDWNRSCIGVLGYEIECSECRLKYNVGSITRRNTCPSWKGEGDCTFEYLVPKDMVLPNVITPISIQTYTVDAEIVSKFTKDAISEVIDDMLANRYSTRLKLPESKQIVSICNKRMKTKSINKIVPFLRRLLVEYDSFEWNPASVLAFRKKEQIIIENNEKRIVEVISKSYRLEFD